MASAFESFRPESSGLGLAWPTTTYCRAAKHDCNFFSHGAHGLRQALVRSVRRRSALDLQLASPLSRPGRTKNLIGNPAFRLEYYVGIWPDGLLPTYRYGRSPVASNPCSTKVARLSRWGCADCYATICKRSKGLGHIKWHSTTTRLGRSSHRSSHRSSEERAVFDS